jgi:stage III sporulation protein AH
VKKIIHKNQVVITTLAVLIAIAGYVSYDRKSGGAEETKTVANMKEDALSDGMEDNYDDIAADISDGESVALASTESGEEPTDAGETVLTSAVVASADYAAQVKLNREQVRSKNKETLQAIIDSATVDEAQKQAAIDEMVTMTDLAEKESNAEMMLEAKGFQNVVVSITDEECDVVLDMGDVTDAKRAQVEDIVKRKTGVAAENIVITPIE